MRKTPHKAENYRLRKGKYGSDASYGNNGCFVANGPCGAELTIIASDGEGWEHVSVSCRNRTPNWKEMCFVKDMFWCSDETVIQYHPPESEYVNQHPNCLHLWRPVNAAIPLPPSHLVGIKDPKNLSDKEREGALAWGFRDA